MLPKCFLYECTLNEINKKKLMYSNVYTICLFMYKYVNIYI